MLLYCIAMYCYVVIFGVLWYFLQMVVLCSVALCCHLYDIMLAYLWSFSSSSTVE